MGIFVLVSKGRVGLWEHEGWEHRQTCIRPSLPQRWDLRQWSLPPGILQCHLQTEGLEPVG